MIKLKASDLIKRAQQLADLENSDFISWSENINLLNESYQKLYQQSINSGEKLYVESVSIGNTNGGTLRPLSVTLPDDFYQLESLQDADTNRAILRRSVNQPMGDTCYEISGNVLKVYGSTGPVLRLNYYPVPKTLTYPAKDTALNLPSDFTYTFIDFYADKVAYYNDGKLYVYNGTTGASNSIAIDFAPSYIVAGRNGIFIDNHIYTWALSDTGLTPDVLIIDSKKNILIGDSTAGKVYTIAGREVCDLPEGAVIGALDENNGLYYIVSGVLYYQGAGSVITFPGSYTSGNYFIAHGGALYMLIDEELLKITTTGETVIDDSVIAINKLDDNTGYGYTVNDIDYGLICRSFVDDTALDYPSNLFIQIIAYAMAIAYKAKQNADASALAVIYDEALMQYFDALTRDAYAPVRIQNVL